jgi:hypothetical protein
MTAIDRLTAALTDPDWTKNHTSVRTDDLAYVLDRLALTEAVVEAAQIVVDHWEDEHPYLACHTGDHMPALSAAIEGSTE